MRLKSPLWFRLNLVALIIVAMLAPVGLSHAQSAVTVRISPASVQVVAGQNVDVAVEVVNIQAMYGFDVMLSFDPSSVEVVDANPNIAGVQVAMGVFMDPGFAIINTVDNTAGALRFVMTQLNPSQPKSGTGNLIVVKFLGKQANASSQIKLVKVDIAQNDGAKIPTTLVSGQIDVVPSQPGPTYTSVPTQGPGTVIPTTPATPGVTPPTATTRAPTITQAPTNTRGPTNTHQPGVAAAPTNTQRPPVTATSPAGGVLSFTATLPAAVAASPTQAFIAPTQTTILTTQKTHPAVAALTSATPAAPVLVTKIVVVTAIGQAAQPTSPGSRGALGFLTGGVGLCVGVVGLLLGGVIAILALRSRRSKQASC
jgi:hypothetical protein